MRRILFIAIAGIAFAILLWLRWPEPPGLDQSLFTFYGHWLGRGLVLYRDLWDSKPPGIFCVYAVAERIAGVAHAAWCLDACAAAAAGILAARLGSTLARRPDVAPWRAHAAGGASGLFALFLPSAPVFGSPLLAGQAEVLATPLFLAAALASRNARRPFLIGLCLGAALCLKIVAVFLLPLAWIFAPRDVRVRPAYGMRVFLGIALPIAVCAIGLALHGALGEAFQAVLVYPRAYAAEISSRMSLAAAIERGALRLGRGLPLLLLLGVFGGVSGARHAARAPLVWLGLAALGVAAQWQMAGYHLYLLIAPLALLAGLGAERAAAFVASGAWRRDARRLLLLAAGAFVVAAAALSEARLAARQYAPHRALRAGRSTPAEFLIRLGGPGPAWLEAGQITSEILKAREAPSPAAAAGGDALLVWGLAPAVYARAGLRPATRFCFHQTLLVVGSPLSRRWPDARARRAELLERMRSAAAPRFVVIASGDRSGLEPQDSRAELREFPELAAILAARYRAVGATRSYELLELSL